ncbi:MULTISPECIES: co-chaperone GroES [unclassified Guyparkeria]|jgi:chaperonin GroES|uniref:co-chaperone GroES n=1 Tax=unclassified Guyparkeria TaxID=2626246 RepID=UPI000733479E|nr:MULTISPECIES: co-chaperone GroES [unclassified Guyparkeria]KTG16481.1 molecular chaperone GroES [Guyparkeria sp. XI15]OAE85421.1 molecular chaperone GroES [Guyparkeria sp. WRN-7]
MKIRPLHDRVLVKREEEERKTAAGIVLPDSATEKPNRGEIVAAGPGKSNDKGEVRQIGVKVGDKVLFSQYAGTKVKVEDEELLMMGEDDILAVIED